MAVRIVRRVSLLLSASVVALQVTVPSVVHAQDAQPAVTEQSSTEPNAPNGLPRGRTEERSSNDAGEIVIVGSRLTQTNLDTASPVTIIDRQRIDALGVTSIGDALKYLPQQSFNSNYNAVGGGQTVQLRGLGVGTTLVLVNGRRQVPGAVGAGLGNGGVDLNSIPLAAVDHIEVLADSGSAVYGADAVGGVVNIVLKSRIDHPTIDAYYGGADGGADERRVSMSAGAHNDRAEGMVVLDYFDRGALLGFDRALTANNDYRRFGGTDRRVATSIPANVCAVSGNLPGLSTPCAAVPAGSTGIGLTPASFQATAGQQNLQSFYAENAYVNPLKTYGALATGSYHFSSSTSAFVQFMFNDRTSTTIGGYPQISNALVPATNPYNPFGVPVRVNTLLVGPHMEDGYHERLFSEVAGLKGSIHHWDWEISFASTQTSAQITERNYANSSAITAALSATSPAQALNVFADGPGGSPSFIESLLTPDYKLFTYKSDVYQAASFVRGEPFRLPAGAVQVVLGGEWRRETVQSKVVVVNPNTTTTGQRDVYAGYFEVRLPLLSESFGIPVFNDVTATVAGRYDHYSDFGGTYNGQYGLEWRPIPSLLIRGSYGESYRAPTLYTLFSASTSTPGTVTDPRRGNQVLSVNILNGGNPNLQPEISSSRSVGFVWAPESGWHPRLSANFWRIKQNNRLVQVSAPVLLANESYLPAGVIVRAVPTPADIAAGLSGQLLSIDRRPVNFGNLDTSGVDLEASATIRTGVGTFMPLAQATYVSKYTTQDFVTSPIVRRAGMANVSGSVQNGRLSDRYLGVMVASQSPAPCGTFRATQTPRTPTSSMD